MRRAYAILLLVLFSSSLIPTALFSDGTAKLPVCCRRDGKHRCSITTMTDRLPEEPGVTLKSTAKCPLFPKGGAAPATGKAVAPMSIHVVVAMVVDCSTVAEQAEAQYRIALSRGWQKRGPPSLLS